MAQKWMDESEIQLLIEKVYELEKLDDVSELMQMTVFRKRR
jgi:hypothetical protein